MKSSIQRQKWAAQNHSSHTVNALHTRQASPLAWAKSSQNPLCFLSLECENERKLIPYIKLEMAQNSLNSRFPETSGQLKQLIDTRQLCLLRSSLQNLLRKSEVKESSPVIWHFCSIKLAPALEHIQQVTSKHSQPARRESIKPAFLHSCFFPGGLVSHLKAANTISIREYCTVSSYTNPAKDFPFKQLEELFQGQQ